jgi:hypothetical protein
VELAVDLNSIALGRAGINFAPVALSSCVPLSASIPSGHNIILVRVLREILSSEGVPRNWQQESNLEENNFWEDLEEGSLDEGSLDERRRPRIPQPQKVQPRRKQPRIN